MSATTEVRVLSNYVAGKWQPSGGDATSDVVNPSTGAVIARVPMSTPDDVAAAVAAAREAFPGWRRTPVLTRTDFILRYRMEVERRIDDVVQAIAEDAGKALADARAEVQRCIGALDNALSVPMMLRGTVLEDVARGVDAETIRQPVGVVAMITPFNFPMFSSVSQQSTALACGNTIVWKPSEQTPLTNQVLFDIIDSLGLPPGVWNLVNGGREVVDFLVDSPDVAAVSSVSSATVAASIYARAATAGKRVQALGGAKNYMLVAPDAVMAPSATQIVQSGFGFAGQRCMAGSVVVPFGGAWEALKPELVKQAQALKIGDAREDGVDLGPVISAASKERIEQAIELAISEGAKVVLDGRGAGPADGGFYVGPTILEGITPEMTIAKEEIFGPVLAILEVESLDDAIGVVNDSPYGNGSSIFTESGSLVRKFRAEGEVGMIGVNIGVAAPVSMFPFTGWKSSLFGQTPIQAEAGVEFFTRRKATTTRWFS